MLQTLSKEDNIENLIKHNRFLILQFGTNECNPCHAISYKLEQWGRKHPKVAIRYIPLEEYAYIASQMGIYSAPIVLTYVEGKLCQRECGYFSMEQLFEKYERYLDEL